MSKFNIVPPSLLPKKEDVQKPADNNIEKPIINYPEKENIINDTNLELNTFINSLKGESAKEKQTKDNNTNSRFWFAVYFQNEEQKNEFLSKINAAALSAGQYINGLDLARVLGIDIKKKEVKKPGKFKNFSI